MREREMGRGEEMGNGSDSLFSAVNSKGRTAYKIYAGSVLMGILSIWFYRATHVPPEGRWAWLGLFAAELWFGFYWILTQSARWNPIYYHTHKGKLFERFGDRLPCVDIFVCTADPNSEPPALVMSTVLSLMAYDYAPEKLSVYLSDDAGSILTFYALWEVSRFANHWLPYCRKFGIESRSPAAYFSKSNDENGVVDQKEWSSMKKRFDDMTDRINRVVAMGKIPENLQGCKGFSKWNSTMTSRNHRSVVEILIDGRDQSSTDMAGNPLPTLVYMAREKLPQYHHNFKAGAMNALIRVSAAISDAPVILNVDCDMYSNNCESVNDALCFFLDKKSHDLAYVQYPQYFANITKNDLYANSLNIVNGIELMGTNHWGGPLYIGSGCFHRREVLCGRIYSSNYDEDWTRGDIPRTHEEEACTLEEKAEALASCTYEKNTLWGKEVGLVYGCAVEDVITGLRTHCRGWRSICHNPERRAFIGLAPTTLEKSLVQYKRWAEGNLQIVLSKSCSFIQGHGKIKLGLQMAYCIYGLWAANSLPTIYCLTIPPLCLLKGIPLYPKVSSPWFKPFAYVIIAKHIYSLAESLQNEETLVGWWNSQRMWVFRRLTSYLFATIDTVLKFIGLSKLSFAITAKVNDEDESKMYEQEIMQFGSNSGMNRVIATVAVFNLVCLLGGLKRVVAAGGTELEKLVLQLVLCVVVVGINAPAYEAMFIRKDKGSIPLSTTFASLCLALLACLVPVV